MKYTITIDDIKAYLATLAPDDEAAQTIGGSCLVERALEHKYHQEFRVGWTGFVRVHGPETSEVGTEITRVIYQFDDIPDRHVTRAEVEAHIPALAVDVQ